VKAYKKAELFLHGLLKKMSSEQTDIMNTIEEEMTGREEIEIDESMFDRDLKFTEHMLTQVIFVSGHLAIKMLVYIESIDKLLEKRHQRNKMTKRAKTCEEGGDAAEEDELDQISGVDDAALEKDKEFFRNITEVTLIQKNILSKIVPIVLNIIEITQ
jgi:condensin complex subunit 1